MNHVDTYLQEQETLICLIDRTHLVYDMMRSLASGHIKKGSAQEQLLYKESEALYEALLTWLTNKGNNDVSI